MALPKKESPKLSGPNRQQRRSSSDSQRFLGDQNLSPKVGNDNHSLQLRSRGSSTGLYAQGGLDDAVIEERVHSLLYSAALDTSHSHYSFLHSLAQVLILRQGETALKGYTDDSLLAMLQETQGDEEA